MSDNKDSSIPYRFRVGSQESLTSSFGTSTNASYSESYNTKRAYKIKAKEEISSQENLLEQRFPILPSGQLSQQNNTMLPTLFGGRSLTSKEPKKDDVKLLQIIDGSDDESMIDYRYCYFPEAVSYQNTTIEAQLAKASRLEIDVVEKPINVRNARHYNNRITSHKTTQQKPQTPQNEHRECEHGEYELDRRFRSITLDNKYEREAKKEHWESKIYSRSPVVDPHSDSCCPIKLGTFNQEVISYKFGEPNFPTGHNISQNEFPSEAAEPLLHMNAPKRPNIIKTEGIITSVSNRHLTDRNAEQSSGRTNFYNNMDDFMDVNSQGGGRLRENLSEQQTSNEENSMSTLDIKSLERSSLESNEVSQYLVPDSAALETNTKAEYGSACLQPDQVNISLRSFESNPSAVDTIEKPMVPNNYDGEFKTKLHELLEQTGVLNISANNTEELPNETTYTRQKVHRTWRGVRAKIVASHRSSLLSASDDRQYPEEDPIEAKIREKTSPKRSWFKRVHETNQKILRTATRVMFSRLDEFQGISFDRLTEVARNIDSKGGSEQDYVSLSRSIHEDSHTANPAYSGLNMAPIGRQQNDAAIPRAMHNQRSDSNGSCSLFNSRTVSTDPSTFSPSMVDLSKQAAGVNIPYTKPSRPLLTTNFQHHPNSTTMSGSENSTTNSIAEHRDQLPNPLRQSPTPLSPQRTHDHLQSISSHSPRTEHSVQQHQYQFSTPSQNQEPFLPQFQNIFPNSSMPTAWKMKSKQPSTTKQPASGDSNPIALAQKMIPLQVMGIKREKMPNNNHGMYGYL